MTDHPQVQAPGATFNFAQHLIERNTSRPAKIAYIDDQGSLSYGDLTDRIRRVAAALLAQGVRREERVLLLTHDCSDWPVSFLGAMYAGIVPVAVNTLLSADDYHFMLQHSRAQMVIVSQALLPTMQAAMAKGGHEVKTVLVSRPDATLPANAVSLDALISLIISSMWSSAFLRPSKICSRSFALFKSNSVRRFTTCLRCLMNSSSIVFSDRVCGSVDGCSSHVIC